MPRIVLCKTANSNEDGVDAYREAFEAVGFQVQYIPVLQEAFRLDELRAVLQDRNGRWAGVVITSKRGAEAWVQAVATLNQTSTNRGHFIDWSKIQLFAVGASSLDHLAAHASAISSPYKLDTSSAIQAKSANDLLPIIFNYPFQNTEDLLVIRGDKSTEELQRGLMAGSREFTELIVYTTSSRPTLDEDVEMLRSSLQEGDPIWVVFFSPSSAEMVLRSMDSAARAKEGDGRSKGSHGDGGIFEGVDRAETGQDCGHEMWSGVKIATIGETTAKYLAGRNINVDAVAKEPTAQRLAEAIQQYDEDQRNTT